MGAAIITAIMRSRTALTDTTTIIPTPARPTDITAQTGFITASFLALVPGTDGAGVAAADTGVTIGVDAAGDIAAVTVAADMDTTAAMVAVDMATTGAMLVADMDTTVAEDITVAAGPMQAAVDTTVVAVDSMAAEVAASTVVVAADSTAAVAVASTAVAVGMVVADIANPQLI